MLGLSVSLSVDACQVGVRIPPNAHVVSLNKKRYPHCSVLVGSVNGFEHDLQDSLIHNNK